MHVPNPLPMRGSVGRDRASLALGLLVFALMACGCACRKPPARVLECHIDYADTTQTLVVDATSNPYAVPSTPIEGRFDFRAVYVTEPLDLAGLSIYVYQTGPERPALVHELKLRPPYSAATARQFGITGLNLIYDERSRELQYWCGFTNKSGAR